MSTMTAFRWDYESDAFVERSVPVPEPGPGQILLAVGAAGVCLSDVHFLDGSLRLPYPMHGEITMGHEVAGTVTAVGDGVTGWSAGDRALSQVMRTDPTGAITTLGFDYDGGWAEYMLTRAEDLVRIPASLPFEQAAIIPDAVSTPWGAISSTGEVRAGEAVGVWGVGGLGVHAVQLLRIVGAAPIIAVDPSPAARERALKAGADVALDPTAADFAGALREASGGGIHVAIEVSGAAVAQHQAIEGLRAGGRLVLVGINPEPLAFETWTFMNSGKQIRGHYGALPHHAAELVHFVQLGRLDLTGSVSTVLPLSDVRDAVHRLEHKIGDPIRIVLKP